MREEIERFFRSYRDAYNSGDPAAIARHIAVPSLMLEHTAIVWSTQAEVLASMEGLLRSIGAAASNRRASSSIG